VSLFQQEVATESGDIASRLRATQLLLTKKEEILTKKDHDLAVREQQIAGREAGLEQLKKNLQEIVKNTKKAHDEAQAIISKKNDMMRQVAALELSRDDAAKQLTTLQQQLSEAKSVIEESQRLASAIDEKKISLVTIEQRLAQLKDQESKLPQQSSGSITGFFHRSAQPAQQPTSTVDTAKQKAVEARLQQMIDRIKQEKIDLQVKSDQVQRELQLLREEQARAAPLAKQNVELKSLSQEQEISVAKIDAILAAKRRELVHLAGELKNIRELIAQRHKLREETLDIQFSLELKRKEAIKHIAEQQTKSKEMDDLLAQKTQEHQEALLKMKADLERMKVIDVERKKLDEDLSGRRKELAVVQQELQGYLEKFKTVQEEVANKQQVHDKLSSQIKTKEQLLTAKEEILIKKEQGLASVEESIKSREKMIQDREAQVMKQETESVRKAQLIKALAQSLSGERANMQQELDLQKKAVLEISAAMDEHTKVVQDVLGQAEKERLALTEFVKNDIAELKAKEQEIVTAVDRLDNDKKELENKHQLVSSRMKELQKLERTYGKIQSDIKEREEILRKRTLELDNREVTVLERARQIETHERLFTQGKQKVLKAKDLQQGIERLRAEHSELQGRVEQARQQAWAGAVPVPEEPSMIRNESAMTMRPVMSLETPSLDIQDTISRVRLLLGQGDIRQAKSLLMQLEIAAGSAMGARQPLAYDVLELKNAIKLAELG